MKSNNIAAIKADLLQKQALSLLPKDKENINQDKKILKIQQSIVGETEINLLETDSVSSTMLLAQKWPFQLLDQHKKVVYAFMAGNDTLQKGKNLKQKKCQKNLLNLSLLFRIQQKQQSFISMLAADSLLKSLRIQLEKGGCQLPLHIRWKHDILIDNMKVGQISSRQAATSGHFYTQLNIEVSVKSIPKNFGAYDFQPTFLEKHLQKQVDLTQLAINIIINLVKQLNSEQSLDLRRKQIKQNYQKELIYMNEKVTIYDTKYEHIHHTGKFLGVTDQGHAILEGHSQCLKDGNMKFFSQGQDYLNLYRNEY